MNKILKKIALWFIISILASIVIYSISSIIFASFDFRDWNTINRFFTGFIMGVTICIIFDEISDLDLEQ